MYAWMMLIVLVHPVLKEEPRREPPPSSPEVIPSRPVDLEVDLDEACDDHRWIGVLKLPGRRHSEPAGRRSAGSGTPAGPGDVTRDLPRRWKRRPVRCPESEGWHWLFAAAETGSDPPPPGLQRYCYYEGSDPRDRFRGGVHDPFESVHRDCHVVGPAAKSIFSRYFWPLRRRFVQEARGDDAAPTPNRTRLVIVDSVRDEAEVPEREECTPRSLGDDECSPHGWALANLAKDLLCNPGHTSCEADIGTRRVLRRTYEIRGENEGLDPGDVKEMDVDETGGGLYGSWRDLALAIRREVAEWWPRPGRPNLVLNLSVGWESIYGENVPEVRSAVEDAVCRGALVVAAAGNRRAGPASLERPLLPAAWEVVPAPTFPQCRRLLGERPARALRSRDSYRPLLYAVGGVRQGGRVLSNGRPEATPRLVAFGDHAPALTPTSPPWPDPLPGAPPVYPEPMTTLTGTSVSTLVVSAAAAVQWNKNPGLSSFTMMDRLWRAHEPHAVGRSIDFCLNPERNCRPAARPRRIFVHPPPVGQAAASPWPGQKPPVDPLEENSIGPILQSDFPSNANVANCDPELLRFKDGILAEDSACPQRWLLDVAAQPWLGPQPGSDHNPDCTYIESSPGKLVLEFDPCFRVEGAPVRLDDLTLIADGEAFRLPKDDFQLGDPDRPCPSRRDDDPRRVHLVLTDFPVENPDSIYLAAKVKTYRNGVLHREYAAITPILHVRNEDD